LTGYSTRFPWYTEKLAAAELKVASSIWYFAPKFNKFSTYTELQKSGSFQLPTLSSSYPARDNHSKRADLVEANSIFLTTVALDLIYKINLSFTYKLLA